MFSLDRSTRWLFFSIFLSAVRRVRASHVCDGQTFSSSVKTTCLFTECLVTEKKCPSVISNLFFFTQNYGDSFSFSTQKQTQEQQGGFSKLKKRKYTKQREVAWHAFQEDVYVVLESWKLPYPLQFILLHSVICQWTVYLFSPHF